MARPLPKMKAPALRKKRAQEPPQRRVGTQAELGEEHLEAAPAVAMGELGPGSVEGPAALPLGNGENLRTGDVEDLGLRLKRRISQGQAIRSVLGRARVTQITSRPPS
jgi:hypothetical protein